jgi:hypothetical protein
MEVYTNSEDIKVYRSQIFAHTLAHDSVLKYLGLGLRISTRVNMVYG